MSCGNQPANISLIIVEAANARPGAKGKGEGKRKIHLTPVTPYQLGDFAVDAIYKFLYTPLVNEKPLFWVGSSLEDLREFPEDARRDAGHFLRLVQQGLEPPDFKPIGSVGPGVYEIRIHTKLEHRVFYIAKFTEGIYVLHAFQKKTQKTPAAELELGRCRLKQVLQERSGQNKK